MSPAEMREMLDMDGKHFVPQLPEDAPEQSVLGSAVLVVGALVERVAMLEAKLDHIARRQLDELIAKGILENPDQ